MAAAVAAARGPAARPAIAAMSHMLAAPSSACAILMRRGAWFTGAGMMIAARNAG
jgi:hypothetical protein